MKVYALETHYGYEGDTLLSIHATRESAERAAEEHRKTYAPDDAPLGFVEQHDSFWKTWTTPEYHITAHEVQP